MNEKQKAKVFDLLCEQISQRVEEKISDWLHENPFWEIDDEDTRHYPSTTRDDAIDAICEDILEKADNIGLYDFFEVVLSESCSYPIGKGNKYIEKIKEEQNGNKKTKSR